jgi:hypothetical protein
MVGSEKKFVIMRTGIINIKGDYARKYLLVRSVDLPAHMWMALMCPSDVKNATSAKANNWQEETGLDETVAKFVKHGNKPFGKPKKDQLTKSLGKIKDKETWRVYNEKEQEKKKREKKNKETKEREEQEEDAAMELPSESAEEEDLVLTGSTSKKNSKPAVTVIAVPPHQDSNTLPKDIEIAQLKQKAEGDSEKKQLELQLAKLTQQMSSQKKMKKKQKK